MTNTYIQDTPQGNQKPSASYPLISANFQYLQTFGSKDHNFPSADNVNSCGTHAKVTLTDTAAPGFTGGNSVLYSNAVSGNSQLFFQNALGSVQLTAGAAPTIAASGAVPIPGGMLLQWGTASKKWNNTNDVSFTQAFSVAPYYINYIPAYVGGFLEFLSINTAYTTTTHFRPVMQTTFGTVADYPRTIFWIAIGPA